MSNVKRIRVEAEVPFNYYEDADLAQRFAFLQSPSVGTVVKFDRHERYLPNAHGGQTAMYRFSITGEEAIPVAWITRFVERIAAIGGAVEHCSAFDIEAEQHLNFIGATFVQQDADAEERS